MIEFNYPLLNHQQKAFDKLKRFKVGALFMDMGTGKTRTMLEIIKDKYDRGKIDEVIWLCPCSAKENIKKELNKHLKTCKQIFHICGIESLSSSIRINSYLLEFVKRNRCLLVVDESQKIKNFWANRTSNIIRLGEFTKYRYILNGNVLSRDEIDIFSQFYFLDWRILGYKSYWGFKNNHVKESMNSRSKKVDVINVDYLTAKIAPYSYQVKKEECLELPDKIYKNSYYNLSDEQRENYYYVYEYLLLKVDELEPHTIYRLFTCLQLVCSGYKLSFDKNDNTIKRKLFDKVEDNPRIKCLIELLKKYGDDEKIIIYCEFKSEIDDVIYILERIYGENSSVRFDGSISLKERNKNKDRFENEVRFFVANKDCASYSLNLQFCHNIIYYSNDWDYGTRGQSEDRVYRIGQYHKVLYVNILANNTLEETIISCLDKKERLIDWFRKRIEKNKDKDPFGLISQKNFSKKQVTVEKIDDLEDRYENIQSQ